jgi:hypothetical protein
MPMYAVPHFPKEQQARCDLIEKRGQRHVEEREQLVEAERDRPERVRSEPSRATRPFGPPTPLLHDGVLLLRQDFAELLMRRLRDVEEEVGPDP